MKYLNYINLINGALKEHILISDIYIHGNILIVLHEFQDFFSINTLYLEFLYTPIFLNEHNTTREKKNK